MNGNCVVALAFFVNYYTICGMCIRKATDTLSFYPNFIYGGQLEAGHEKYMIGAFLWKLMS